jgi:hypothetical protein
MVWNITIIKVLVREDIDAPTVTPWHDGNNAARIDACSTIHTLVQAHTKPCNLCD